MYNSSTHNDLMDLWLMNLCKIEYSSEGQLGRAAASGRRLHAYPALPNPCILSIFILISFAILAIINIVSAAIVIIATSANNIRIIVCAEAAMRGRQACRGGRRRVDDGCRFFVVDLAPTRAGADRADAERAGIARQRMPLLGSTILVSQIFPLQFHACISRICFQLSTSC